MHRVLSQPIDVEMAGWTSNTYRLQQAGWRLSACQDVYGSRMQLAMIHDGLNLKAMTMVESFPYQHDDYRRTFPVLSVRSVGHRVVVPPPIGMDKFRPIDAQPMFVQSFDPVELEDFAHFAPAHTRTKQLILPEATVPDLMARILEIQQPMREEEFKRMARDGALPKQEFHAQIISLAA